MINEIIRSTTKPQIQEPINNEINEPVIVPVKDCSCDNVKTVVNPPVNDKNDASVQKTLIQPAEKIVNVQTAVKPPAKDKCNDRVKKPIVMPAKNGCCDSFKTLVNPPVKKCCGDIFKVDRTTSGEYLNDDNDD